MKDERLDQLLKQAFDEPVYVEKELVENTSRKIVFEQNRIIIREICVPIILISFFNLMVLLRAAFWLKTCLENHFISVNVLDFAAFMSCIILVFYLSFKEWASENTQKSKAFI